MGAYPAEMPARPIRMLFMEASGDTSRLPEIAFGAGNLPNDVDTVVVLIEGDVRAARSSSQIPAEDIIHTAAGDVPLPKELVATLCGELKCTGRRALTTDERRLVDETALALKMKFGTVSVLPMILNGRGFGKILAGALMREFFKGRTLVIAMIPARYVERNPSWRSVMAGVITDGWNGQSVPLTAMAALEIGRQLKMTPFELIRRAMKASDDAPEKARDLSLLALLESRATAGIAAYGRERAGDVPADKVIGDVSSMRDLVSGDYEQKLLNATEQKVLLALARSAMMRVIGGHSLETSELPQYSKRFLEPLGCKVSIYLDGKLFNTKTSFGSGKPLLTNVLAQCGKIVKDEARPLDRDTLEKAAIEVCVFSKPFTLCYKNPQQLYAQLRKGRHGVILKSNGKASGFVPSFWSRYDTPEAFMAALCARCGKDESVLMEAGTEISVFEEHLCREKGIRTEIGELPDSLKP